MRYNLTRARVMAVLCLFLCCPGCSAAVSFRTPDMNSSAPSGPDVDWIPWLGKNGTYGYADRQGVVRIQPRFVDAKPFAFGRAPVSTGGSQGWGFINAEGAWLVTPCFTKLDNGRMARAAISFPLKTAGSFPLIVTLQEEVDAQYIIDSKNRVHPAASAHREFSPPEAVRRTAVEIHAAIFVMDDESRFFFYSPRAEGGFRNERLAGIMDREGKVLTKPEYTLTSDINFWAADRNFPMLIQRENLYGYVAPGGAILVPPRFIDAGGFCCGYAQIKEGGLWGLLDTQGRRAAPFIFSRIQRIFPSGLIQAEYKGRNILWDSNTQRPWIVDIPPKGGPGPDFPGDFNASVVGRYTPGNFTDALVIVSFPAYTNYPGVDVYTRAGVFLGTYSGTLNSGASRLWLRDGTGKWGALDMAGRTVIPFLYDRAQRTSLEEEDIVRVERDGKSFYMDGAGREYRER